jgi:hypothetical protein
MLDVIQNLPAVGFAKEARGIHHSGGRIEAAGQGAGVSPPPFDAPRGLPCLVTDRIKRKAFW